MSTQLTTTEVARRSKNPAYIYLGSLRESGRRTMEGVLSQVAAIAGLSIDTMDWASLRYEQVVMIRTKLGESGKAPATINKVLAALKSVARESWRLGQMSVDDYMRIRDVGRATGESPQAGRALTVGEVDALFRATMQDETAVGIRDCALLSVLFAGGLRREEASGLALEDVEDRGDDVVLDVMGKRAKPRRAFLSNGAANWVRAYLDIRGPEPGRLFWSGRKDGRLIGASLSAQAIYFMVARRALQAGLADISPHDLRRTYCSELMARGVDLLTVQRMLGHSDPKTTARYDRRPEEAQAAAATTIHVPFRK